MIKTKKNYTIGVIMPSLHEGVQSLVWPGIADTAKKHGVKLVTYMATSQDQISSLDLHYTIIRDFVKNGALDGLITFTGAMAEHLGVDEVKEYCNSLSDFPIEGIALSVPNAPSVLVDNRIGIVQIVDHLVIKHKRKKIAFIKGPDGHEEAQERYEAYCEGLRKNNLPLREELVLPGQFLDVSGIEGVTTLIENNISFDALITADDETAFGALKELKRRGVKIPGDVAVAGFDDVTDAAYVSPALTTVRQPLYKQGKEALLAVLSACQGKKQESIFLSAEPVYRRSCGCFPEVADNTTEGRKNDISRNEAAQAVLNILAGLYDFSSDEVNISLEDMESHVNTIISSFIENVENDSGKEVFLNSVDHLLLEAEQKNITLTVVQGLLSAIAGFLPSLFKENRPAARANHLLQRAIVYVNEQAVRITQSHNMRIATQQLKIRETSQKLITTFEIERLLRIINTEFPELDISSLFVALYEDSSMPVLIDQWEYPKTSCLLLGYQGEKTYVFSEENRISFPSAKLFPHNYFDSQSIQNCVFLPLFFKNEHFGFIVFEYDQSHQFFMYEELRLHLSSAMKSSFLLEELKTQSIHDELTDLYNRRGFINLSNKLIKSAGNDRTAIWIYYVDLDGLKKINDTYGHEEGDFAISAAARILTNTFRKQDIIGRIGGDEFTVLVVTDPKQESERSILDRLQNNIDRFNEKIDKPYSISMSVGISRFTGNDGETLESVMKRADDLMLIGKREKKAERE
ncbi:diguanylate cyclase [Chitinispirillum alkaliphilum]|nr:diguanylate cyclase [Chitinispirillum alkaliphilum]